MIITLSAQELRTFYEYDNFYKCYLEIRSVSLHAYSNPKISFHREMFSECSSHEHSKCNIKCVLLDSNQLCNIIIVCYILIYELIQFVCIRPTTCGRKYIIKICLS